MRWSVRIRWIMLGLVALTAGRGLADVSVPERPAAVRISSGVIAPDHPNATPWYLQEAEREGPTVLIIGGMHGNEPAGAVAADQIRHWRITRGRLIVIPRANPLALAAGTRFTPDRPRETRNLNRNFARSEAPDDTPRGPTAEALWVFIRDARPDWVLDLHEGFDFHTRNPESVGSSIISYDDEAILSHVERMLKTVNAEVAEEEKRFASVPRGPIQGGLVRAAHLHLGAHGMVLETTYTQQPLSLRTRQHRLMVHAFLSGLGMIEHGPRVRPPVPWGDERRDHGRDLIHVALYDDAGTGGTGVERISGIVEKMSDATITLIGPAGIREGALDDFDVVVFPGGGGGTQGGTLGEQGRENVRSFVRRGGGYLGICAGAYLATCRQDNYLKMVRAYHYRPWRRGRERVDIELTDAGRELLGPPHTEGPFDVRYANGPLFFHEDGLVPDLDLPDFDVLAVFRSASTYQDELQEMMVDTPAIVSSTFHDGRLMLISPHPESDDHLAWIVERSLRWAAGRIHHAAGVEAVPVAGP